MTNSMQVGKLEEDFNKNNNTELHLFLEIIPGLVIFSYSIWWLSMVFRNSYYLLACFSNLLGKIEERCQITPPNEVNEDVLFFKLYDSKKEDLR